MASVLSAIANKLLTRRVSETDVPPTIRFNVDAQPRNSLLRRQSVAAESFDPAIEEESENERKQIFPKSDSQRNRLTTAINDILLFRCLDKVQKIHVIDAMKEKKVSKGDVIIRQGDDGEYFYVIEKGEFDIYIRDLNTNDGELGVKVNSYNNKGSFGELALMYNTSRAASIVAKTDGLLWLMDRTTFRKIVLKAAFLKRQMYEKLLEEVPLLKELNPYERKNVADALHSRTFLAGSTIITQGEKGKAMFIIESGIVKIVRKENSKEVEVNRLTKGNCFGEIALITKKPRAASAYAVEDTNVAILDVASFERLMGPCLEVMKRNFSTYAKQLKDLLGSHDDLLNIK